VTSFNFSRSVSTRGSLHCAGRSTKAFLIRSPAGSGCRPGLRHFWVGHCWMMSGVCHCRKTPPPTVAVGVAPASPTRPARKAFSMTTVVYPRAIRSGGVLSSPVGDPRTV
jgi:hypothetical protein